MNLFKFPCGRFTASPNIAVAMNLQKAMSEQAIEILPYARPLEKLTLDKQRLCECYAEHSRPSPTVND